MSMQRCSWCGIDPLYVHYHDQEWAVPVYDSLKLFELLLLESMQAGLSWITILRKRENFRHAFANFTPTDIAQFTSEKMTDLLSDPGIIRNRLKVQAAVNNAKAFLQIQAQPGGFTDFLWKFSEGRVITNRWQVQGEIPTRTSLSDTIAKELKQRGFSFMGTTTCYAYMQAMGMVNDHLLSCFRHNEVMLK
jgi:DNA-3-methyladenine glycosylase I